MRQRLSFLAVIGWYLAWAFYWTRGAWADPSSHAIGAFEGPDVTGTFWTWWWTAFSIREGHDTLSATWMYHPYGLFPVAQLNLVDALLAAPFYWAFGPVPGYNTAVLVMLAVTGLAAHLVARWEGVGRGPALFAGTALLTSDFVTAEMWAGKVGQGFLALLLLSLGLWRLLIRGRGGWGLALATGITSALCFLEYWYYGLFLGFSVLVMLLAELPRPAAGWRPILQRAALATVITLLLALPFVLVLLGPDATLPGMKTSDGYIDHGALGRGEPGLNWALDFSLQPSWPFWPRAGAPYMGAVLGGMPWAWLAIALVPLIRYRKGRLGWVLVGLTGWILALGPYPRIELLKWVEQLPLPFLFLREHLPFFDRLWWPYRLASLCYIALAVLAALNLESLSTPIGRRRWIVPLAALGILVLELVLSGRSQGIRAAPVIGPTAAYRHLDGPTVTLPIFDVGPRSGLAFTMQAWHEQPILYGMGAHIEGHQPAEIEALYRESSLLTGLRQALIGRKDRIPVKATDIEQLSSLGYRYVLLDRRALGVRRTVEKRVMAFLITALGPPLEDDGDTAVWRIPASPQDVTADLSGLGLPAPLDGRGPRPQDKIDLVPREPVSP